MIVRFPEGTAVHATECGRPDGGPDPDFCLYLDECWSGAAISWDHELLDWPDHGLPADPDRADSLIVAAFERARAGEVVEVGCLGGSGRTGTVLACMAVLAGVPSNEAVEWLRAEYRASAVETVPQRQFVQEFGRRHG